MEELLKPDTDGFFKGDVAKVVLKYLLEVPTDYPGKNMPSSRYMIGNRNPKLNKYPCTRGYYQDEKTSKWVAFDNLSNECFVEDFPTEVIAQSWLRYEIDVEDIEKQSMITKKVKVITELEIQYNPDLVSIDNIINELDYSFTIGDIHADVAKIKETEILEWQ